MAAANPNFGKFLNHPSEKWHIIETCKSHSPFKKGLLRLILGVLEITVRTL